MVALLKILDRVVLAILSAIVIFTNLAVTGLILFLVATRFFFGWSVVGVLELATFSAIWLYMCGAVVAARNKEHLVVDFLSKALKTPKAKAAHNLIVSLIMVVLSVYFISLANDMVAWSVKRPQTTAALSIPLIIPQSAIVVAAILCSAYALRDLIVSILTFKNPQASIPSNSVTEA